VAVSGKPLVRWASLPARNGQISRPWRHLVPERRAGQPEPFGKVEVDILSNSLYCRECEKDFEAGFMALPHYVSQTQVLRRVARNPNCRFIWTRHAIKAVADDGRTTGDVEFALMNGQVVLHEQKQDLLWRVEGKDIDGGRIQVVVAVYEEEIVIKVVTTF
jgi:hypothetical protein